MPTCICKRTSFAWTGVFSEHDQRIQECQRRSGIIKVADMSVSSSPSTGKQHEILRHRQTVSTLPCVIVFSKKKLRKTMRERDTCGMPLYGTHQHSVSDVSRERQRTLILSATASRQGASPEELTAAARTACSDWRVNSSNIGCYFDV